MNSESTALFQVSEASFGEQILNASQPVLVLFWAPWSRPCSIIKATLLELAKEIRGRIKVAVVDADDSLNLSVCYMIQSVPTLVYFLNGTERDRIIGTASREAILRRLEPLVTQLPAPDFPRD